MNMNRTPTPEQIAAIFHSTPEAVKRQLLRNAAQLEEMAANPRQRSGYSVAQLGEMARAIRAKVQP